MNSVRPTSDWTSCFGSLCDSPVEPISRDDIDAGHPVIAFDAHWRTLAAEGTPLRSALYPPDIPHLLKWLMILQAGEHAGRPTFHVRLEGTAASALSHGDLTGRELAEFTTGESYRSRLAALQEVIAKGEPRFGRAVLREEGRAGVRTSVGMFPFRTSLEAGHQVVVVAAPDELELRQML